MKKLVLFLLSIVFLLCSSSCDNPREIDFDKIVNDRPIIIDEKEEVYYTVTFQTNGGTKIDPIETNSLTHIQSITQREGYNFIGWYLDPALTQETSFPITVTENITLYAKWEAKKYTVNFVTNGGTAVSNLKTDVIHTSPTTKKEGYAFEGWYLDSSFTVEATFPIYLNKNITLHAKWLKKVDTATFSTLKIKDAKGYSSSKTIDITPKNLDLEELAKQGYFITITVYYDVEYDKDYDMLWDIGYFGAPKYEVYLDRNYNVIHQEENVTASSYPKTKTISYTEKVVSMKNAKFYFRVSTDNIQNIIYFDNIVVTYECTK